MTEKKKGVVLETAEKTITVLTPQGEFLNVPWNDKELPQLGSEIDFTYPLPKKKVYPKFALLAVAASLLLIVSTFTIWSGLLFTPTQEVAAYINVDINPSIELALADNGQVIEASGLNDEGNKLLEQMDLVKRRVDEAVELITVAAVKEQYLSINKENAVLITVSGGEIAANDLQELDNVVKTVLSDNKLEGEANLIEVPLELHKKAQSLQLSTGKYVVWMEAQDLGLDISLEEIKNKSIVNAVKSAGGIPGQLISKAKKDSKILTEIDKRTQKRLDKKEKNRRKEEVKDLNGKGYQKKSDKKNMVPPGQQVTSPEKSQDNNKDKFIPPGKNKEDRDQEKVTKKQNQGNKGNKEKPIIKEKNPPENKTVDTKNPEKNLVNKEEVVPNTEEKNKNNEVKENKNINKTSPSDNKNAKGNSNSKNNSNNKGNNGNSSSSKNVKNNSNSNNKK